MQFTSCNHPAARHQERANELCRQTRVTILLLVSSGAVVNKEESQLWTAEN